MRNSILLLFAFATYSALSAAGNIVVEGVVNAPVPEVWKAWTTEEGLKSWLAPHADIDLRLGGVMRVNYAADGTLDDAKTIENEIIAFDPEHMLAIRVSKSPADFPFQATIREMWTVLYFDPEPTGGTHLRIVGLGFREAEESQKMRQFFERGNAFTLEQLQQHFGSVGAP